MANIIDKTFFVGDLEIPQTDQAATLAALNAFIAQYEPEFLRLVLGYDLYLLFKANVNPGPATDPYTYILDGVSTFTNRYGVLSTLPSIKRYIACYVYFHWMRQQTTKSTPSGEKVAKAANAFDSTPYFKACRAWNEMVDYVRTFREYMLSDGISDFSIWVDPVVITYRPDRKRQALYHVINPHF